MLHFYFKTSLKLTAMIQNKEQLKTVASIGEEISHELGAKMVKDYQDAFQGDVIGYQIGKNIIEQIFAQPGCVGIRFYNALNEIGEKTLVYVGVDEFNNSIYEYSVVCGEGSIKNAPAIVGDRSFSPADDSPSWNWY
jgi:hypothetical protein